MTGSRRAAQVLELAVLTFVLGTIVMGAWIAGLILGVVDSHQVDDTMTLLLVLGPQGFTLGVGIAAVVSLRRNGPWGPFLGRLWAVLETIFALLAASRFLVLASRVVLDGWTATWSAADAGFAFVHPGGTEQTYWTDLGAVGMLVVAVIGLIAAVRLVGSSDRQPPNIASTTPGLADRPE